MGGIHNSRHMPLSRRSLTMVRSFGFAGSNVFHLRTASDFINAAACRLSTSPTFRGDSSIASSRRRLNL